MRSVIGVRRVSRRTGRPAAVGATNDAKALADALVRYAGFPSDRVHPAGIGPAPPAAAQPRQYPAISFQSHRHGSEVGLLLVSFAGPRGEFLMGSATEIGEWNERLKHELQSPHSTWMGKYRSDTGAVASSFKIQRVELVLDSRAMDFLEGTISARASELE